MRSTRSTPSSGASSRSSAARSSWSSTGSSCLFAIAKRVVVLDAGSVIAAGPADEVFELPIVRKAYFEDAGEET